MDLAIHLNTTSKMKKIITKITVLTIIFLGLISCENDGYEKFNTKNTPGVALSGEWFVDINDEETGTLLVSHALHKTFDSNDGKMYIDDAQLGWWIKGKLTINPSDLTFHTTDEPNLLDPGTTFTITEGKIIKNAAISKSGNVVDSIYFKVEFSYEPGVIYIHSGHKRTGFTEDEY